MCLEQGVTGEELDQDAADAPDVTRKAPAKVEDDFWGAIVSGGDDGRVVFVIKGGGTKVDKPDFGIE